MQRRSLPFLLRLGVKAGLGLYALMCAAALLLPDESPAACPASPFGSARPPTFEGLAQENEFGDRLKAMVPSEGPAASQTEAAAKAAASFGAAFSDAYVASDKKTSSVVFLAPYEEALQWRLLAAASLSRNWLRVEFEFDRVEEGLRIKEVWTSHPHMRIPFPNRPLGGCPFVPWLSSSPPAHGPIKGRQGV